MFNRVLNHDGMLQLETVEFSLNVFIEFAELIQ